MVKLAEIKGIELSGVELKGMPKVERRHGNMQEAVSAIIAANDWDDNTDERALEADSHDEAMLVLVNHFHGGLAATIHLSATIDGVAPVACDWEDLTAEQQSEANAQAEALGYNSDNVEWWTMDNDNGRAVVSGMFVIKK